MKHFITASIILAVSISFCIFSSVLTSAAVKSTKSDIESAREHMELNDVPTAANFISSAMENWKTKYKALELVSFSNDLDWVYLNLMHARSAALSADDSSFYLYYRSLISKLDDMDSREKIKIINLF